ncbi:MAG: hypothetical protein H6Q49_1044 [Deltaproteobacteria bacterium]|nr:hypothetical protein [Deltaproteobacteria bacterium]
MKKLFTIFSIIAFAFTFTACVKDDSAIYSSSYGLRTIASYHDATLYVTTTPLGDGHIKVIRLSGSFQEMGRQYGYLLKTDLQNYYQNIIVDYLMGVKGMSYNELVAGAEESYANALADTRKFMQGIVKTSGLTLTQIQLINNSMLEVIAACSAVVGWGQHTGYGPLVIGRNWDMNTGSLDKLKDYMMVVVYNPPTGNSVADINYMGQFQYFQTAINDKRLWIDMQNGSLSSTLTDNTKQDPNSAIFQFLRSASTMDQLDTLFMAGAASASFIMTAADPNVAYSYFWCTQGTYRFSENNQSGLLATANHFVEYPETWTINTLSSDPATQMYTELRRNNWLALANSPVFYGNLTDETMKTMLGYTIENGGGSFPASGYAAETIYQIVAVPRDLRLWIRLPKYFGWEKIELLPLFD